MVDCVSAERINKRRKIMKYVVKMSNAYGNTAVHSTVDTKEQAEALVHRLITSEERYNNHFWWEELP